MPIYEYKVVPAPKKGLKAKGIKTSDARFANAMMAEMNEMGAQGWQYQRSETLPCEERSGLRGRSTTFMNMLVFRREIAIAEPAEQIAQTAAQPTHAEPTEHVAQTHAPLMNAATNDTASNRRGAAPALGPATNRASDAVEVKDPRIDVDS